MVLGAFSSHESCIIPLVFTLRVHSSRINTWPTCSTARICHPSDPCLATGNKLSETPCIDYEHWVRVSFIPKREAKSRQRRGRNQRPIVWSSCALMGLVRGSGEASATLDEGAVGFVPELRHWWCRDVDTTFVRGLRQIVEVKS